MRLQDLYEEFEGNVAAQRASKRVRELNQAHKQLMSRASSAAAQSGIKPEYAQRVKQSLAQIDIAKQQLAQAIKAPEIEAEQRSAAQKVASDQVEFNSPEQRKQRFGQAVSSGFDNWAGLRNQYGGDEGIDQALITAAMKQTEDGAYPLDVAQLAQEFDIPVRSLYRWLERPSLVQVKRMTPAELK